MLKTTDERSIRLLVTKQCLAGIRFPATIIRSQPARHQAQAYAAPRSTLGVVESAVPHGVKEIGKAIKATGFQRRGNGANLGVAARKTDEPVPTDGKITTSIVGFWKASKDRPNLRAEQAFTSGKSFFP